MQCSRLLYPFAWLPRRAKHHGQKVTRLSDFENVGWLAIRIFTIRCSTCCECLFTFLLSKFQHPTTTTRSRASINHGRNRDGPWTIHGQLASILAAQRLRHALSRKRCAARSIVVHERPWHINGHLCRIRTHPV